MHEVRTFRGWIPVSCRGAVDDSADSTVPHVVTQQDVARVLSGPRNADRVQTILERALNYRQCVRTLHEDLDVPDEVVAKVAGVHPGSVRRWRSNDPAVGEPRQAQAQRIEWLRRIALVLVASGSLWDLKGIGVWLQAGRQAFRWRAPFEVLASDEDGFEQVLHEAEQFVGPGAGGAGAPVPPSKAKHLPRPAGFGPPRADLADEGEASALAG